MKQHEEHFVIGQKASKTGLRALKPQSPEPLNGSENGKQDSSKGVMGGVGRGRGRARVVIWDAGRGGRFG